jgi:hypothetical protein
MALHHQELWRHPNRHIYSNTSRLQLPST